MKAPRRRRPRIREITTPPAGVNLSELAKRAHYVGSPEHKDHPSFAGQPRPRADASLCDPALADSQAELTRWLRAAIRAGYVGPPWEGGYPRYAWHRQNRVVYEARLVDRGNGEYKGYPLEPSERPPGLK